MLSVIISLNSKEVGFVDSVILEEISFLEARRVMLKWCDRAYMISEPQEEFFVDIEYYDGDIEEFKNLQVILKNFKD
jgi:hypothetical protein